MSDSILSLNDISLSVDVSSRDLKQRFVNIFSKDKKSVVTLLKNISLNICEGDRVALVGRNGSGKTTLLKLIAGIYHPSSGVITRAREVRYVADVCPEIEGELSGYENAKFMATLLYGHRADYKVKLKEALEFSELKDHLKRPFKFYSTGMRKRLTSSIHTMYPANLLLLDEFYLGADIDFETKLAKRFQEVVDQSQAFIMVNHGKDVLDKWCSKHIEIENGTLKSS